MLTNADHFNEADLAQLKEHGVSEEEARRQIALLQNPPPARALDRPCTQGDGIERIPEQEMPELVHLHQEAARAGRLSKFVPASGAATRMFAELEAFRSSDATPSRAEIEARAAQGDEPARVLATFLEHMRRFAFFEELREVLTARGRDIERLAQGSGAREILEALLGSDGLGYATMPKALIKFHRYEGEARTAFEENLVEAASLVRAADASCRLQFTIQPADAARFEAFFTRVRSRHERKRRARFLLRFTTQDPRTDTLALDSQGGPFRDDEGRLLLRPGGHGALLANLNQTEGDIVHVKNIDNVPRESLLGRGLLFRRLLVGRLVELQGACRDHVRRVERREESALHDAQGFLRKRFFVDPAASGAGEPELRRAVLGLLRRPLRVCGMVPNAGEPGGAPFFVRGSDGTSSVQIVEGAEVDPGSADQQRIFRSATHFNPVDMVVSLKDAEGRAFDLSAHAEPLAVLLSRKTWGGRELRALERPGLWNGGMAGFGTVLVEFPAAAFTPVKSVLDLLREEHQEPVPTTKE